MGAFVLGLVQFAAPKGTLPHRLAVWKAHNHQVAAHRRILISLFAGALVSAGLLAMMPGRLMHKVIFGG